MRKYLEKYQELPTESLAAMVPINVRSDKDEAGGNLFDRRWHGCHIPDGGILRRRREEDGPADQVGDHSGHDRLD